MMKLDLIGLKLEVKTIPKARIAMRVNMDIYVCKEEEQQQQHNSSSSSSITAAQRQQQQYNSSTTTAGQRQL